jgi:hypothetical protein
VLRLVWMRRWNALLVGLAILIVAGASLRMVTHHAGPLADAGPQRRARLYGQREVRPVVDDVDGDGTDDVLALAEEGGQFYLAIFDGAKDWQLMRVDLIGEMLPYSFLAASGGRAVLSTPANEPVVVSLRRGEALHWGAGPSQGGGLQELWIAHEGPITHVRAVFDGGDTFELDHVTNAWHFKTRHSCFELGCQSGLASPSELVSSVLTPAAREALGRDIVLRDGDRAYVTRDRFIVHGRMGGGLERTAGGSRSSGEVEWSMAGTGVFTERMGDALFFVSEAMGLFFATASQRDRDGFARETVEARSVDTGQPIWQVEVADPGPLIEQRGRLYVRRRSGAIEVFEAASGKHLASLSSASVSRFGD